jgi:hypothetical protein
MSKTFTNIVVNIGPGVVNNRPIVSGSAVVAAGGTNNATVSGSVVLNGGTNSSTAAVTGTLTLNSGTNAAAVTGPATISGGTNSGAITGATTISGGSNSGTITGTTTINGGTNTGAIAGGVTISSGTNSGAITLGPVTISGGTNSAPITAATTISGGTNTGAITGATTISGGTNSAPITGTTIINGGDNTGDVTGTVTISSGSNTGAITGPATISGGTNSGAITGATTISGGTNTGAITGPATISGGANSAPITGTVIVSGGTNTGTVTGSVRVTNGGTQNGTVSGDLYVEAGATISSSTAITGGGKIYAAADVNVTTALAQVTSFTGTVVQTTQSGVLTSTTYTSGTAGATAPVTGVFYNLEGGANAGKAYVYDSNGTPTPLNVPKFNLTGDGKAYNWNAGVQGGLFTGTLDGVAYVNGVVSSGGGGGAAYNEYDVTFVGSSGKLYSSLSNTVTSGPLYTNSALTLSFTGAFQYNSVWYYADAGVPYTYIAYTVTGDTNGGVLYSHPIFNADPGEFIYTNTSLTSKYSGLYKYQNTFYAADDGTVTPFDGAGTSGGQYYNIVAGSMNVASENYATDINVLFEDGKIYDFDGAGGGAFYTGQIKLADDLFYDVAAGVLGALSDSIFKFVGDEKWYSAIDGVGVLFNGAYYNGVDYVGVSSGLQGTSGLDLAYGVLQLANDGKYYTFDGTLDIVAFNGALKFISLYYSIVAGIKGGLFNGAAYEGDNYRPVVNGTADTQLYANGILQLDSNGKYYTFNGSGTAGTLFTGVTSLNGLYYSIVDGVGTLFNGAFWDGTYYRPIINGVLEQNSYANGVQQVANNGYYYDINSTELTAYLFTGVISLNGLYYNVASGLKGALFNGAITQPNTTIVRPVVNGVINQTAFADGIQKFGDDYSKYYKFNNTGNASEAVLFSGAVLIDSTYYSVGSGDIGGTFTGAYLSNGLYYNIDAGAATSNLASDTRMLASDGLYYDFAGGNIVTLANHVQLFTPDPGNIFTWLFYYIAEGIREANPTFTGAYFYAPYNNNYNVNNGSLVNENADGVRLLYNEGIYYLFQNGPIAAFNGAIKFGDYYYSFVNGARETTPTFQGAYLNTANGKYSMVYLGGVPSTDFANGTMVLAEDGLYYNFTGNGEKPAPLTGVARLDGITFTLVENGVLGELFTGVAEWANGIYYPVINGAWAVGAPIISPARDAADLLWYNFSAVGGAYYRTTLSNGAVEVIINSTSSWYPIENGVKGPLANFTGFAYMPNGNPYEINNGTSGGYIQSNSGVRKSAVDGKYYIGTYYQVVEIFTGAVSINAGPYIAVKNGVSLGAANGGWWDYTDNTYYVFSAGQKGGRFTGATTVAGGTAWFPVVEGIINPSAIFSGAVYDPVVQKHVTIVNGTQTTGLAHGNLVLADDGELYNFGSGVRSQYPYANAAYTVMCDDTFALQKVVVTGFNQGDYAYIYATRDNSSSPWVRQMIKPMGGANYLPSYFANGLTRYGVTYYGEITEITACSSQYAD